MRRRFLLCIDRLTLVMGLIWTQEGIGEGTVTHLS